MEIQLPSTQPLDSPEGGTNFANMCRPPGYESRCNPYPSAYADGSSCVALRATEVSNMRNFKTYASGYEKQSAIQSTNRLHGRPAETSGIEKFGNT